MNKFIEDYSLKDTFAYLDNVTIGGPTKTEHDKNVDAFLNMVQELELTLNHKTIRCVQEFKLLGYCISHGLSNLTQRGC